jgi:hypothetical protein
MAEIPTEALEAARMAVMDILDHYLIYDGSDSETSLDGEIADAIIEAAASYLIAEGRRQVIAELRQLATPAGPLLTPLQIVKILELGARIATKGAPDG